MATWNQGIHSGGFLGGIGKENTNAPQASDVNATLSLIRQNNDFARAGGNNVGLQALQGLQGLSDAYRQNQQAERQKAFQQEYGNAFKSGDRNAMRDLAAKYPDQFENVQKGMGFIDDDHRTTLGDLAMNAQVAAGQRPEAFGNFLKTNADELNRIGVNPADVGQTYQQDPKGASHLFGNLAMFSLGPKGYLEALDKREGRDIDRGKLAETERSNRAGESVQWANVGIAQQNANIRKAELQGKAIDAQIARETNQVKLAELQDRRTQNQREIEQARNEKSNSVAGNLFDIGRAITVGNELGALVNEHPTAVSRNQGGVLGWAPNIADDTRTLAAKTDEYNLKVVLPALRGTFGGNPTEGERQALMQSSNNLKKATSNKDFLNELNRTQDTLVQMQKRQIRGLGVPVTRSSDEATDTQMLLSDPSLVKEYITTHGYLPEAYYKAQFSGGK